MAAQSTARQQKPVSLEAAARHAANRLHEAARRATPAVAARALRWAGFKARLRELGLEASDVLGALAQQNDDATKWAIHWQRAIGDFYAGRSELVPWRQEGRPELHWGIRKAQGEGTQLGWLAVVARVLTIAGRAALVGAGWQLADSWIDTEHTEAEAKKLDAETRAAIAQKSKDPRIGKKVLDAMKHGNSKAQKAGPDWIDRLEDVGAGIGSGALIAFVLWMLLRRREA